MDSLFVDGKEFPCAMFVTIQDKPPTPVPAEKTSRRYLTVPHHQKEDAKALGARWDDAAKKWYVPEGLDGSLFVQWPFDGAQVASTSEADGAVSVDRVDIKFHAVKREHLEVCNAAREADTAQLDTYLRRQGKQPPGGSGVARSIGRARQPDRTSFVRHDSGLQQNRVCTMDPWSRHDKRRLHGAHSQKF